MSFFIELKRRNVFRVAIAYLAAAWLLIEVSDTIFPYFGFGESAVRILIVLLAIACPLFLIFSWVFEITPEGLMLEKDVAREKSITATTGKSLDRVIIVLLTLALSYFAFDKFILDPTEDVRIAELAHQEGRTEAITESYGEKSIVVLPFVNVSQDLELEYLSDGISQELINRLARIPDLRVISRSSAFFFKGKDLLVPEIARRLNVNFVLEGSVMQSPDQLRVTAQLIDAHADTGIWSQTYDRGLDDIFSIQDNIASSVISHLEVSFLGSASNEHDVSPEAYTNYLRGWHFWNQLSKEGFEKSYAAFQTAIDLEPEYAMAWVGLATVISGQTMYSLRDPIEGRKLSRQTIDKAILLDSSLPEAYCILAAIETEQNWNWQSGLEAIREARKLDPNGSWVNAITAITLLKIGHHQGAIPFYEAAIEVDPLFWRERFFYAIALINLGLFDEAESELRFVTEVHPHLGTNQREMGWIDLLKGDYSSAKEHFENEPNEIGRLSGLSMVAFSQERHKESDSLLMKLRQNHSDVGAFQIATIFAWRGEVEEAISWLERSRDNREGHVQGIFTFPLLAEIREDPRTDPFLETIGLSSSQRASLDLEDILNQ